MKIYLVQHGSALSKAEDPSRPLSAQGADCVRKISHWAQHEEIQVSSVYHSGKRRAEQTAEIIAEQLEPQARLVSASGMGPNDDIAAVIDNILEPETDNIMLVGHLPFLDRLTSLLVSGDPEANIVQFHNAAIVCLEKSTVDTLPGESVIEWIVQPELIP